MINDKKITFLLGAGASIPFIISKGKCLSSSYITDALFERDRWKNVTDKLSIYKAKRQDSDSYLDNIDIDDILFVLERIKLRLRSNERFKNLNFEHIIHLLDKVADYLRLPGTVWISNIDEILFDFWVQIDPAFKQHAFRKSHPGGWHNVPFLAREVLIDSILALWPPESVNDSISLNKAFYSNLLSKFQSVNLYSLNYDPLLYEALKNLPSISTGFDKDKFFKSDHFFRNNSIFAFVHGQVGFEPLGNKMKLNDNYSNAQENRMKGIFDNTPQSTQYWNFGMKGVHYNTYLITGLDKIDAFPNNPFASYIQRFGKDIIDSDYIALVGTSLNDHHLRSFLTNALSVSSKKILFVTKADTTSIRNCFTYGGDNVFFDLVTLFRDPITVRTSPYGDALQEHFNRLSSSLDSNGYGMLANHVLLYIKGTEEFYKEPDIEVLWEKASVA